MQSSRRLLVLAAVAAFLAAACTAKAPAPARPSSRATPPKPRPVAAAPAVAGCTSASLAGHTAVGGLGDSVLVPALPGADRVSYGEVGNSQYVAEASASDVLAFYQSWMPKLCWQARALSTQGVTYARGDQLLRLSWAERPQIDRVLVNYESNVGRVLAATYSAAQTTCPAGQFSCNNVCVPDGTTCSPSGGTTGGTTSSCPAPPSGCTSGYTYDSQGCASGCIASTSGTTGGTTCPTPPTGCTSGYTYDSQGCATGCAASTGGTTSPSACSADQVRCYGTGDTWGWCQYPPCPSSTGGTTSATPTTQSDCTARAMYWCTSSAGGSGWCQSWSCPVECPSGQYSCNGACVSNTTSCGGGTSTSNWPQTQADCSAQSKIWCPGTNGGSGWCQSYPPCPSNTGSTGSTWPSTQADCTAQGKTWCPSGSGSTGGACYYNGPCPVSCPSGQYSCNGVCKPTSDTNCPSSGGGSWATCPSNQWQCDGSCIPMTSPCHGWYTNGTQSPTGGTATGGGTTGGTVTGCSAGFYWCPATNSCISNTATCGTAGGQTGTTGQVGVAQPQQCGQCKYASNGQCVFSPQGMADPNCASGQLCDGYGGCATIRPKYVADGALCPNKICETKFGETRENCPIDCGGVTVPTSQPPTGSPYPGQFPGQGQGNEGQFQGQPGQFPGGPGGPGGFPGGPGGPGGWGPSEEEMKQMQVRQLEDMKRGMREARRGMEMMKKEIARRERDAKRCGTVVPPEAKNALEAMGPLLAKIEAAQTLEEAMDAMSAMQEVGEELRDYAESGFRDAPMLCEMKKRAPTELKRFEREAVRLIAQAKRVKNNEGLVELARELELKVVEGKNQLAKALGLIATDPEAAVDAFEELWMIRDDGEHLRNALRAALDARRVLPELKRDIRRNETELKRFAKSGRDVSEVQDLLAELKAAVADLEQGIKDKVGGEELVDLVQIVYAARAAVGDVMSTFYGRGEYEPQFQIRDKAINFNLPDAFDRQSYAVPVPSSEFGGEGFGGSSGGVNSTAPGAP